MSTRAQTAPREKWLQVPASDGGTLSIRVVDVARARHLRLSLGREGPRLSKPRWVSLRDAAAFATEKREWLEARLAERTHAQGLIDWPEPIAGASGSLCLRGETLAVHIEDGSRPQLLRESTGLRLLLPPRDAATRRRLAAGLLKSFFENEMRHDIAGLLARHSAVMGRAPTRVSLRPLRSLWGSLSTRDHLSLDLALILAEPDVLEYVLVHELAHLFERNHGPRFWARVAAALPDYRERQRRLRAHGDAMKSALAMLLDRVPA